MSVGIAGDEIVGAEIFGPTFMAVWCETQHAILGHEWRFCDHLNSRCYFFVGNFADATNMVDALSAMAML